jgi:DNA-binding transcriptional ArsR family regulator
VEALYTIEAAEKLISRVGINPQRLVLKWVSAAEAPRYVEIVTSFTETIRSLGPLGTSEGRDRDEITFKLQAAKNLSQQEKFRWVLGKRTEFAQEGNAYGEVFTQHELTRLLDGLISEDLQVHEILLLLAKEPLSVKEVAQRLQLEPALVLKHMAALRRRKLVDLKDIEGRVPSYTLVPQDDRKQNGC